MWVVFQRQAKPDAVFWPGRRALAAVDALAWPALWVLVVANAPLPTGVFGPTVTALAALFAVLRLQRAVLANHRYWFTTVRWGKVAVALIFIGMVMKLAMRH